MVTEGVRQNLAKKHKQLGEAILELLVQKLRNQGDEACNLCKNISRRLGERNRCKIILIEILCFLIRISFFNKIRPLTIEDLTEQREWMETVPIELERINEEVQDAINDYDLIEEFYYPLSQVITKFQPLKKIHWCTAIRPRSKISKVIFCTTIRPSSKIKMFNSHYNKAKIESFKCDFAPQ